jgi:Fe-S cluster assembly ATP-binding protein
MLDGQVAETGGAELAILLEDQGYDWLKEKSGKTI